MYTRILYLRSSLNKKILLMGTLFNLLVLHHWSIRITFRHHLMCASRSVGATQTFSVPNTTSLCSFQCPTPDPSTIKSAAITSKAFVLSHLETVMGSPDSPQPTILSPGLEFAGGSTKTSRANKEIDFKISINPYHKGK
jgi:hypothetical protein